MVDINISDNILSGLDSKIKEFGYPLVISFLELDRDNEPSHISSAAAEVLEIVRSYKSWILWTLDGDDIRYLYWQPTAGNTIIVLGESSDRNAMNVTDPYFLTDRSNVLATTRGFIILMGDKKYYIRKNCLAEVLNTYSNRMHMHKLNGDRTNL